MKRILTAFLALATAACGGGGGSSGGGGGGGGPQLPTGSSVGSLAITGGAGAAGTGGNGGGLQVTSTGDAFVLGGVDIPDPPSYTFTTPSLGANPRTVALDQAFGPDGTGLLLGDDGVNPATGLWVKPGATATLLPAVDGEAVTITFSDGILVEGTLSAAFDSTGARTNLVFTAGEMTVGPEGVVDLTGGAGASDVPGGNAGGLHVTIGTPGGAFQNQGTIDLTGGPGSDGGLPGSFGAVLQGAFASSGTIHADGGEATSGLGGPGGAVVAACAQVAPGVGFRASAVRADATTPEEDLWIAGTVTAASGAGPSSIAGGNVLLAACNGWLASSGSIDVSGHGPGAAGGIAWALSTSDLWALGSVDARGGGDPAAALTGGPGGTVFFGIGLPGTTSPFAAAALPAASGASGTRIYYASDVDARGGDGVAGGTGGAMVLAALVPAATAPVEVRAGLPEIRATGSAGATGGAGGSLDVSADAGAVAITVPVVLDGGPASADGYGGDGGHAQILAVSVSTVAITASGATSAGGPGGSGGTIEVGSSPGKSDLGGSLSVKAGTGTPDGVDGVVTVDGADVPLSGGVYSP